MLLMRKHRIILCLLVGLVFAEVSCAGTKKPEKLAPHPRLFVSAEQIERMVGGRGEDYQVLYDTVAAAAEVGLTDTEQPMENMDPWRRAIFIQGRTASLVVQWFRTKDRKYFDAALKTVKNLRYSSRSLGLIEGQHSAALAVVYDLLHNDMTPGQRKEFVDFARDRVIRPFLKGTGRGEEPYLPGARRQWWQDRVSNWNAVSISGAGMLALTMYEDLDEAQAVIDRVDGSLKAVFDELEETQGAWVEGLGYWNWTIHYTSLFMISYERATGNKHDRFRSQGFRKTLTFGQYFVPNGEPCGFGDNQHGNFSPSLFAAAEHLGYTDELVALQAYAKRKEKVEQAKAEIRSGGKAAPEGKKPIDKNPSYDVPFKLLIDPDPAKIEAPAVIVTNMAKHYPKQGWGMVADQWPKPNAYAAVRGGVLGGEHTHDDLLSWHGVVGIERMISSINEAEYLRSAFQGRSHEIYERSQHSKNTLFIAGVTAYSGDQERRGGFARASTKQFELPTGSALRLEASGAFYSGRGSAQVVARLFTTLGDKGVLVIDRVAGGTPAPVEVRTHTDKKATFGETDVLLEGTYETARITFASDQRCVLRRATALLTSTRATPPVMMRWQTSGSPRSVTMASFLSRGSDPVKLNVTSGRGKVTVTAIGKDWQKTVELNDQLEAR
jgi:hypothetical protein